MKDQNKTKKQLINELMALRQTLIRTEELEKKRLTAGQTGERVEGIPQKNEEEVRRLAKENAIMAEIGRIISSTLYIEEVYELFAKEVHKLLSFDRITICAIDPDNQTFTVNYISGLEVPEFHQGDVIPLAGSMVEQVMRMRSISVIQTEDEQEITVRYPTLLYTFRAGFRSMMTVPLIYKDRVVAVLHLRSTKVNLYKENDLRLAERVGNQIAGTIANAQLFTDLKRAEESLQKAKNELEMRVAERTAELRKSNEQLQVEFNERKRAEEELRESEEKFRILFDEAPVGYQEIDGEGLLARINRTELNMLDYKADEMLGRPVWDFILERELSRQSVTNKLATGITSVLPFERTYLRKDGTPIPVLITEHPWEDGHGRMIGIRAILLDITKRKRAEENLKKSEELLRAFMDSITESAFLMDTGGNVILSNKAAAQRLGTTTDEFIGRCVYQFLPPEVAQERKAKVDEVIRTGKPVRFIDRREGRWYDHQVYPISNPAGQVETLAIIGMDITDRKRMEEMLEESEARYRNIFEQSPMGIGIASLNGKVVNANKAMEAMTGYSVEELRKINLNDTYEHMEEREMLLEAYKRKGSVNEFPVKLKRREGTPYDALVSISPINLGGGEFYQAICQDITERKRAEEQLKASLQEKEVLLREIYHRVKNNMQVISSMLFLQSKYFVNKKDMKMLEEVQGRIRSMSLVHEKLYRSKDLGRINFNEYARDLVETIFMSYGTSRNQIGVAIDSEEIALSPESAIPCGLILHELVTNSLKHAFPSGTQSGNKLTTSLHRSNDRGLELVVSDNGIGLPPALDFRNTETLGFQLVNTLVRQLQGTISLRRDEGTEFKIVFNERGGQDNA